MEPRPVGAVYSGTVKGKIPSESAAADVFDRDAVALPAATI